MSKVQRERNAINLGSKASNKNGIQFFLGYCEGKSENSHGYKKVEIERHRNSHAEVLDYE
ncbi:hypothetical protein TELCIR_23380 [Teladorsagia circumcincta]|uniref:Uncharacterized protein n=1 Tax=Teladorsagia circumcincta TaxID=45464 RepID=A0A2G9TBC3_TELCI|nr:hypothetical protein TELCIR_23380 [Teladorsagia circumcincta]